MKRMIWALLGLLAMTMTSCEPPEEISFEGIVVAGRSCTSAVFEQNMGYVVQLSMPQGVGGTLTNEQGQQMTNLVVLYEPEEILKVGDRIHGTFYWDEKYSRANCTVIWDEKLPEGVFLDVIVD